MTCQVADIFEIRYGHSLELNGLKQADPSKGIAFVSRKRGDNGISAYVDKLDDIEPAQPGEISCALSGNGVLTTCVQDRPFYTGYHVAILRPKQAMTKAETLFYCLCIKSNRYRYSYGRQANKTLGTLAIPKFSEIPKWVNSTNIEPFSGAVASLSNAAPSSLDYENWADFRYDKLFHIKKGKRLTKANMTEGSTPFIGAIDSNNGYRQYVDVEPSHPENTITVNYNGNGVADAYYQPQPFWASDDVNVLYPKFEMTPHIALFLCTLIRQEKFRFSYGRKWHLGRMNEAIIKLPTTPEGQPDWAFMGSYVKALPYSASVGDEL
jgi:hypothetical protein